MFFSNTAIENLFCTRELGSWAEENASRHLPVVRTTLVFHPLFLAPNLAMDFPHEVSPPRVEPWPKYSDGARPQ